MKKLFYFVFCVALVSACSEPMRITANPDSRAATSGTLGSVKASDSVMPVDTLPKRDTLRPQ